MALAVHRYRKESQPHHCLQSVLEKSHFRLICCSGLSNLVQRNIKCQSLKPRKQKSGALQLRAEKRGIEVFPPWFIVVCLFILAYSKPPAKKEEVKPQKLPAKRRKPKTKPSPKTKTKPIAATASEPGGESDVETSVDDAGQTDAALYVKMGIWFIARIICHCVNHQCLRSYNRSRAFKEENQSIRLCASGDRRSHHGEERHWLAV